jgi:hypothetical protein
MPTVELQLNIWLPNVPGELAKLTDRLRAADVNIEAIFCTDQEKETILHLIVDDIETAKIVLQTYARISTSEVLAFEAKNKPGAIAHIARMCAGANINIRQIYSTTSGHGKDAMVYVVLDDIAGAKKLFGMKK